MVLSFLALYAGAFLALLWLIDELLRWVLDNGLFWYVAAPIATVAWMAHLYA